MRVYIRSLLITHNRVVVVVIFLLMVFFFFQVYAGHLLSVTSLQILRIAALSLIPTGLQTKEVNRC